MMKKNLLVFFLSLLILLTLIKIPKNQFYTLAQTEKEAAISPTFKISPSEAISEETIKSLKDKIATKVAELRQKNKKIVSGVISKKEGNNIELKSEEKIYKVVTDELLTIYYLITNNSQREIKAQDLTKGDFIIAVGPLVEDSINANYIYKDQPYLVALGKVLEVNKENYYLKVETTGKDEYIVDIEVSTKQQILDIKTLTPVPSGFSKIKEGDFIHFSAKKPETEKSSRISASRILIVPQEYFSFGK